MASPELHILEANGESYRLLDSKNRLKKRRHNSRKQPGLH